MCLNVHIVRLQFPFVEGTFDGRSDCNGIGMKGGKEVERLESGRIPGGRPRFFGLDVFL